MPHTHEVTMTDEVVCKTYASWADAEPDREWTGLVHLAAHAPDLAPSPLARDVVDGRPVVVMSRLPGAPLVGRLDPRRVESLIAAVQRLFEVPVPPGLEPRANDPTSFARRFGPWLDEEYESDRCRDAHLVGDAVAAARRWLLDHRRDQPWLVEPVVALGDGNLDNVLWDGERCRLLDWEEFGVSDSAYEIADLVEHASSRLEQRLDVVSVLAALASDGARRERVERHRRTFACFWLAMLLPGHPAWSRNPPGSVEDQARHVLALLVRDGRPGREEGGGAGL